MLEQAKDLNAVIEKVKTFEFVDTDNIFLLGSSMGGATVATSAVTHSNDIRGIVYNIPQLILILMQPLMERLTMLINMLATFCFCKER